MAAVEIDWGDGTSVDVGLIGETDVLGTISGSHVYADNGAYTVKARMRDQDMAAGTWVGDWFSVVVTNVAPVITALADGEVNEGSLFTSVGSFTDSGADFWTATADYGDGSGEQPLMLNADKTFVLSHVYADNGAYTVKARVRDEDLGKGESSAL